MQLSDGPQFPRIELILRSKGLLNRQAKVDLKDGGSREVESNLNEKEEGRESIVDSANDVTRETNYEGAVNLSKSVQDLNASAGALIERSRLAPVLVERSIFDGLSTKARALVYHQQHKEIIERLRVPISRRRGPHNDKLIEPPTWKNLSFDDITACAIAVHKKSFLSFVNRKMRVHIVRQRGKGKLASLHRAFYLKKCVIACLIKNLAEKLALDTSDETDQEVHREAEEKEEGYDDWETLFDEKHQAFYYYNHITGESQWRNEQQVDEYPGDDAMEPAQM